MNTWTKEDQRKLEEAQNTVAELSQRKLNYVVGLSKVLSSHGLCTRHDLTSLHVTALRKALEPFDPSLIDVAPAAPADDGWTTWEGGECPVPGHAVVEAKLRDGSLRSNTRAYCLRWGHLKAYSDWDVIAYRVTGQ